MAPLQVAQQRSRRLEVGVVVLLADQRGSPVEQPLGAGAPGVDPEPAVGLGAQAFGAGPERRPGGPPQAVGVPADRRVARPPPDRRQRAAQIERTVDPEPAAGRGRDLRP
jgi:hypothetical protein